jgi:hypothetical protein
MRIRSIKPEFWQSEIMTSIPHFSRLLAIALLNYSDDDGHFWFPGSRRSRPPQSLPFPPGSAWRCSAGRARPVVVSACGKALAPRWCPSGTTG